MNLDKFKGSGSTPSRRAFWDKVAESVLALQKREGSNASVDEHQGQGTVINFPDQGSVEEGCSCCTTADTVTVEFSGISSICAPCVFTAHSGVAADFNGSYVLPKIDSSACSEYFDDNAATIDIDLYNDSECTDFVSTVSATLQIDAACYNSGDGCKWFIEADLTFLGGGLDCALTVFYSDGTDAATMPIENECPGAVGNCGTTGGQVVIS